MRIKFNIRFLLALAVAAGIMLSFGSCIRERFDDDSGNCGTAYLSVRMNTGAAGTRADGTEAGTPKERQVDEVYLLLYNTDEDLKYAWKLDASNFLTPDGVDDFEGGDVAEDSGTPSRFVTVSREVSMEPYHIVVIANPGVFADDNIFGNNPPITDLDGIVADYTDISSSIYKTLDALQQPRSVDMDDFGADYVLGSGTNKMFMSNANGPVYAAISWLKETAAEAEASPVPVSIDRALGKIIVNSAQTVSVTDFDGTEEIGRITALNWRIRNYNTQEYLIRRFNLIDPALGGTYGGTMETYASGLAVGRKYLYATDPNMTDGTGLSGNSAAGWDYPWNAYADPMVEDSYCFATENVMNASAQPGWLANATYVDIWAKIALDDYPGAKGFYSFNNGDSTNPAWVVFAWDQVSGWWTSGTFPANVSTLQGKLTDLKTEGGFTGPFDFDSPTEPDGVSGEAISESVSGEIYFHSEGSCFYRVPVQHLNKDSQTESSYGYYGIVRNNVYRVILSGFKAPGMLVSSDYSKFISFDILINPWYVRYEQIEQGRPPMHQEE